MTGPSRSRFERVTQPALFSRVFVSIAVLIALARPAPGQGPHYATTPFLEADRCATAWVLSRYLHPQATFSFHDRENLPPNARLYDLPESDLRRDAQRATVEVLVELEGLRDPVVIRLARLVHDVEINFWATRREPGSREFEAALTEAFRTADSPEQALERCFELLDGFRVAEARVDRWLAAAAPEETETEDPAPPPG